MIYILRLRGKDLQNELKIGNFKRWNHQEKNGNAKKKCSKRVERPSSICNATTELRKFSVNLKIGPKKLSKLRHKKEV